MIIRCLFFLLLCSNVAIAQKNRALDIQLLFQGQKLVLDSSYWIAQKQDSIQISTCKFYLSNIELLQDGEVVFRPTKKHFLIDISQPNSLSIDLSNKKKLVFNQFRYTLGIDSTTQVAGAMGKDLDPVNGMYWTWQSGYINCKIEGYSSHCTTRNHFFQYHLGGYQAPFSTQKTCTLLLNSQQDQWILYFDIARFLEQTDLVRLPEIMSPQAEAVRLAHIVAQLFSTKP
ncbi:MAG: hypothetical protein JNM36_10380 [Chitinophagales bacterium]|nr:hypothetical protein [Chitinophagales bacterium]